MVVGSANIDSVFTVSAIPTPGETVSSSARAEHPGGKGLNQAVAAARSGAVTTFIGSVGQDAGVVTAALEESHVVTSLRRGAAPTGSAVVVVDAVGENAIVVHPGANADLVALEPAERRLVSGCRVLLLQLESPVAAVVEAASLARQHGATIVLNAAPTGALTPAIAVELLALVDVLVVNEHEAGDVESLLSDRTPGREAAASIGSRADALAVAASLARSVPAVVVTLGGDGAVVADLERGDHVAAPSVPVVDTTAAGDTFCGALAAELADGAELRAAVAHGVLAGSLAVQRAGAVSSIPWRSEIAVGTV